MALFEHLQSAAVVLAPRVQDKWQLIDHLVETLVAAGELSEDLHEAAQKALVAREQSVSTGMEHGIAVPHAAMEELDCLKVAMAVLPQGVEFQSVDGKAAHIIVMLLVPKSEKLLHLTTLTEIARRLSEASFRERLVAAGSADEVVACWA